MNGPEGSIHCPAAQAFFPVVGAIAVSPCVFLASTIQLVVGGIFAAIGKLQEKITNDASSPLLKKGCFYIKNGGLNMAVSILNMVTLGIPGCSIYHFQKITS